MNSKMLVSQMVLHGDIQSDLAKALGISLQTLNAKINGTHGAQFRQREILAIKTRYSLTPAQLDEMFMQG